MLSTFQFARPWALVLLAVLPLSVWLLARMRRRARMRLPSRLQLQGVRRTLAVRLRWVPDGLLVLAVGLAVVGLARPEVRDTTAKSLSVEGIDIVIALDLSTSMRAADFRPENRLHVAKQTIADFIKKRDDDRIGLVVFAGQAYTQAPLTLDHGVLLDILKSLRTGVIPDGTAIGNAIATALNRLRDSNAKSKVVILVTDGDNNAGNISPMEAAAIAKKLGVKVFTVMVGKGGEVPYPAGHDLWGRPTYRNVEIPVNANLLKKIARTTGGDFYVATDRRSLRENFQHILDELTKTRLMEGGVYVNYTEVFPLAVLPAILLGLLGLLLQATRLKPFP